MTDRKQDDPGQDHYQRIGRALVQSVPEGAEKSMLYAEIEEGVIAASVFFVGPGESQVKYLPASKDLEDESYDFWCDWKATEGTEWRALIFVVEDSGFKADLRYSDQIEPGSTRMDRRAAAVKEHFGDLDIVRG